jgi:hypothetical protein
MTSALAWPIATVVVCLIFYKQISNFLRTAKRIKGMGVEFERDLSELQMKAAEITAQARTNSNQERLPENGNLLEQARSIANISPSAAISFVWTSIEHQLRETTVRFLGKDNQLIHRFSINQINALEKADIINSSIAEILHRMREMRNKVTHKADSIDSVSANEAVSFAEMGEYVIEYLKMIPANE